MASMSQNGFHVFMASSLVPLKLRDLVPPQQGPSARNGCTKSANGAIVIRNAADLEAGWNNGGMAAKLGTSNGYSIRVVYIWQ
jgi:hypothetical protein